MESSIQSQKAKELERINDKLKQLEEELKHYQEELLRFPPGHHRRLELRNLININASKRHFQKQCRGRVKNGQPILGTSLGTEYSIPLQRDTSRNSSN